MIGLRIGEAVHHASIDLHLPIDPAVAHLALKGAALVWWDGRVVRTNTDQNLALDVLGVLRGDRREAAVEADYSGYRCPLRASSKAMVPP